MTRYIITDANWIEPGHRPRGFHTVINAHEANSLAALIDPRPEPGFWPTLAAAIESHPRFARVFAIAAGLAFVASNISLLSHWSAIK